MKKFTSVIISLILMLTLVAMMSVSVFAADPDSAQNDETAAAVEDTEANNGNVISTKAVAAAIVVAVVGATGAIGMAVAISKSTDSMARQPEIAGKINSTMMLGMVFIETAIIYALIVAILIIFVL